jgi:iron complex transport system substrate-binding protein
MLDEMPLLIPEFADILAPLEGVGYPASLEQVALLNPDLILAPEDTIAVAQAGEIAPVIVPDPAIYEDWKLGMEFWAAALNMSERYAEMEENYRTRIAELQSALGDAADDEISVISFTTEGGMLWMPDSAPGAILTDAGLARPEAQRFVGDEAIAEYGDKQWIQISNERIDLADGDAIFYFTYASTDPEVAKQENDYIAAFEQNPIWLSLDAVEAGQAYLVPGHWWRAQTYYLANKVIDDLFANLTETTATTPVLAIE